MAKLQFKKRNSSDQFSNLFLATIPSDDMTGWSSGDLFAVASSMAEFSSERKLGKHKLRLFTDKALAHTCLEIINDDMPFIVDSVTSEIASQGLVIDALFHPILRAKRNASGRLLAVREDIKGDKDDSAESYIYIRLEQLLTPDAGQKLLAALDRTLSDVRAATADWRKMLAKMDEVISLQRSNKHEEADFLKYLRGNNFTFLGYRYLKINKKKQSQAEYKHDLGVLRGDKAFMFGQGNNLPEITSLAKTKADVMISKLVGQRATVHRRVPMDALSIKAFDNKGQLIGMHLFVGLFTSSTYSCRTGEVPMVRQKVRETIERAGFAPASHDHKALEHILEKMPRDELFQMATDDLYATSLGILRLQAKQRIALFTHLDAMQQYMSCLVYVPRDRYNTQFRLAAEKVLEQALGGKATNYFTTLDDSPLARVLFTIKLPEKPSGRFDQVAAELKLIDIGREWDERLRHVLIHALGKKKGMELAHIYGKAFGPAYHESIDIKNAVHDVRRIEELCGGHAPILVDLYRLSDAPVGEVRLKVYHKAHPVPLSDILPVLENMGLKCRSEMPYEVTPAGTGEAVWIHDFILQAAADIKIAEVEDNFEDAFLNVWHGWAENDGLNKLIILANLSWKEVSILRTYNSYMRQAKFPFSRTYIEQVLAMYPAIAREAVHLFKEMHDPKIKMPLDKRGRAIGLKMIEMLQDVQKLDHDRILRGIKTLIENTLRTNFFQENTISLAIKLDSKNITMLPLPRPFVEIFVYSPRVEAVHLRGGKIARGGIRWSDRHDDFRTEILGLMKSQQVKNAVIVPVGAKGGFVAKHPPKTGGREAYQQEGIECYKIFVQSLLDITDNNVKGKIVRPSNVVCYDDVDPYLVVAADKGTATFSNIANNISLKAGFWLQDAFASGGSSGYDHKEIAITARGGWESVKRHFREIGKDIQKEPFTLVGVGDMAGDVFGNAMLLSPQMQLLAAFNHAHIFCDPTPDIAKSFKERERMFKSRLGWDGYDKSKISAGGAVYDRSAKSLKLSSQIRKCFGIEADHVTPDDLIKAILKAEVELIWFGGIGTFVKSSQQSHADADDKTNDNIRIDANQIRAKVVGEGANLGTTQLSRVEYARLGGRINTDFIDNSGGVDCSDHEVNIKILLADVMARGKMKLPERDKLLKAMTNEVAGLVLRDNYQQTQSLSLLQFKAKDNMELQAEFIRDLEKQGLLNRKLEGLPDDEGMQRLLREGQGLTRPELSVLLPYAKMTLYNQILVTAIPDDPAMEWLLFDYFPKALHKFTAEIKNHKLKREIIATQLVNILVNRMGPVFVRTRMLKTGASIEEVMKAFMIVIEAFAVNHLWAEIEALDGKVPAHVQMTALFEVSQVIKRAVTWFLRFGGGLLDITKVVSAFKPGIEYLQTHIDTLLPASAELSLHLIEKNLVESGVPDKMAKEMSALMFLSSANDIIAVSAKQKANIPSVAGVYFAVGEGLGLDWLRQQAAAVIPENSWQSRVMSGLVDDFYIQQAALTSKILPEIKKKSGKDPVGQWFAKHADVVKKIFELVADMRSGQAVSLEMLMLASQRISQMMHQLR